MFGIQSQKLARLMLTAAAFLSIGIGNCDEFFTVWPEGNDLIHVKIHDILKFIL